MLRTDAVIKLLKTKKEEMSFDDIWTNIKEETLSTISKEQEESVVKSDLYMSLMEDQRLIMVGDNKWNLKESYSYSEIEDIKKSRMTDDVETELEETEDTIELKLGLAPLGEE